MDDWDPVPLAVATLITKSFIDTSISGIHILASVQQQCERPSLMHEGLEYSYLINDSTRKIPISTSVIFSFQHQPGIMPFTSVKNAVAKSKDLMQDGDYDAAYLR